MSSPITKTIVSSEDDEILSLARQYGADGLKRPEALASDTASSESVVKHVVEALKEEGETYDYVVLLQPTSPLRTAEDIEAACAKLLESEATALISVTAVDNKILKAFKAEEDGYIAGIANNHYPFMRRQDLPKTYMSNGAIYIIRVDEFMENNSFFTDQTIAYEMDEGKSIDVDTKEDLIQIEKILTIRTPGS